MDERQLCTRLAERAVLAVTFALFYDCERTTHADEVRRKISEQPGAIGDPRRIEQDVIGNNVVPGGGDGDDRAMHCCHQGMTYKPVRSLEKGDVDRQ
jgi:hypothetical protein